MKMHDDTRKLVTTGSIVLAAGLVCVALLFAAFGGASRQGPHNNGGWLMLIFALGCLPMGVLILALGVAKLIGEKSR